jgi:hypothetical protein
VSFLSGFWDLLNSPVDVALERIYHTPSKQWVADFAPPTAAEPENLKQAVQRVPIVSRKNYITVTAQKTVLPYERILFKTFYAAVHSTIVIHDDAGEAHSLSVFSSLDPALTAIDNRAGEKLVLGPRTLLEFAPFQGAQIGTTIALIAVEAVNYAKPLLSTLQKISNVAGATFFSAAEPLAEPLLTGIQALSEVAGGSGIQVAYAGNLPLHTGVFLVAATDSAGFNWSEYSFGSDYTLLFRGTPVSGFAYIVLTIESADTRPNWRQIPALRDAEKALDNAVKAAGRKIGDEKSDERGKVETALLALQWECLNTPDLCEEDGQRVADMAREKIDSFVRRASAGLSPAAHDRTFRLEDHEPTFLGDIELFPRE